MPGVSCEQLFIVIAGHAIRIETPREAQRQNKAAYGLPRDIDVSKSKD